jgi:hypothetical protein
MPSFVLQWEQTIGQDAIFKGPSYTSGSGDRFALLIAMCRYCLINYWCYVVVTSKLQTKSLDILAVSSPHEQKWAWIGIAETIENISSLPMSQQRQEYSSLLVRNWNAFIFLLLWIPSSSLPKETWRELLDLRKARRRDLDDFDDPRLPSIDCVEACLWNKLRILLVMVMLYSTQRYSKRKGPPQVCMRIILRKVASTCRQRNFQIWRTVEVSQSRMRTLLAPARLSRLGLSCKVMRLRCSVLATVCS